MTGRLQMREGKMRERQKCKGEKYGSGLIGTRLQGWKMRDKQVWTAKSLINKTYL